MCVCLCVYLEPCVGLMCLYDGSAVHSGRRHFVHALAHHWQHISFYWVHTASVYFISFCIRTVAHAMSLLLFHHYHHLMFPLVVVVVVAILSAYHVIFHISLLQFSESSICWLLCFARSFAHSDLLTVSRLMRWAFMWREQLWDMPCCINSSPN